MSHGLFKGRYRAASHRRQGWDYRFPAHYHVTICTKNKTNWFGKVKNEFMGLNTLGCIVVDEIQNTNQIRSNVSIHKWVVMPNHVHLVISVNDDGNNSLNPVDTSRRDVSTSILELIPMCRFRAKSLGSIVNHIKSSCTKRIRKINPTFQWQNNYHDRIIRNGWEYNRKCRYISQNPQRWSANL